MKKGFTLIEIIICLVLLTMIGAASIYFIGIKKDDNIIDSGEVEKELYEVSDIYYTNKKNSTNFKYYENDYNYIVTCMRLDTLVNEGLVSEDSPLLTAYDNDDIFKYIIDTFGNVSVEPIVDPSDKTCEYIIMETDGFVEIPDDDPDDNKYPINFRDADNKEWNANYDYSFLNGDISDYKGNISFDMKLKQLISVENISPLYITIILDTSGSMSSSNKKTKALEGINNLITTLKGMDTKVKNNIKLGAVSFSSSATLHTSTFKKLSSVTNYSSLSIPNRASGGTDCTDGLKKAKKLFDTITDPKAVKIAIFLADGACNNSTTAKNKATELKNAGIQIYTIGYSIGSSSTAKNTMQNVASTSKFCDLESNTTDTVCYFDSDPTVIGSTFETLAITSVESSINNPYNKVEFSIQLAPYFEFVNADLDDSVKYETGYNYRDSFDVDNNTLKRTVNITDLNSFDILKISDFNYNVNFLKDVYRDLNSDLDVGDRSNEPLDILSSLKIVLSGSGTPTPIELCSDNKKSCYSEDLPKVNINLSNNSVIN